MKRRQMNGIITSGSESLFFTVADESRLKENESLDENLLIEGCLKVKMYLICNVLKVRSSWPITTRKLSSQIHSTMNACQIDWDIFNYFYIIAPKCLVYFMSQLFMAKNWVQRVMFACFCFIVWKLFILRKGFRSKDFDKIWGPEQAIHSL